MYVYHNLRFRLTHCFLLCVHHGVGVSAQSVPKLTLDQWLSELQAFDSDDDSRRIFQSDTTLAENIAEAYFFCSSAGSNDLTPNFLRAVEKLSQHYECPVRLKTAAQLVTAVTNETSVHLPLNSMLVDSASAHSAVGVEITGNNGENINGSADDARPPVCSDGGDEGSEHDMFSIPAVESSITYCHPNHDLKRLLCPHVFRLLADDIEVVRNTSRRWVETLLLRETGFGGKEAPCICPLLVDQLSLEDERCNGMTTGDNSTEYFLVQCLQIVATVSEIMSDDVCAKVAPILAQLSKSFNFRVRKSCVATLAVVARHVPSTLASTVLVPVFLALSKDNIWGVRKSCAELLPDISSVVEPQFRRDVIAPCFVALAQDESRWVRHAAYKHLGELITTFVSPPPTSDAELKAWHSENSWSVDDQIVNVDASAEKRKIEGVEFSDSSTDDDDQSTNAVGTVAGSFDGDESGSSVDAVTADSDETDTGNDVDDTTSDSDSVVDGDALGTLPVMRSNTMVSAQQQSKLRKRRISPAPWDLEKMTEFLNDEVVVV